MRIQRMCVPQQQFRAMEPHDREAKETEPLFTDDWTVSIEEEETPL